MSDRYPIRNKYIEAAHSLEPSGITSRPMTPEEWEKYGPLKAKKPVNGFIKKEVSKPMGSKASKTKKKTKYDTDLVIELVKKHGLDDAGKKQIAKELGVYLYYIDRLIPQKRIQDALKAAGISDNESVKEDSKKQLIEDTAKELKVSEKPKEVNPKFQIHMNLCADLHETFVAKNTAYGDSFSVTFKEFGIISALTRMSDKWNRIKALATGARNDVTDESLEDSLMDLANDCTMTVMELRDEQKM